MVFRKPYAFLIRHFKLLHLIFSAIMIYLSVKINLITSLFGNLADNVSVSLVDLSSKYITGFMCFCLILIISFAFVICYLMRLKKKPYKFYIGIIGYYIILLIFLIVYNSAMNTLENVSMTNQALRVYRDVSLLLPLGQYYFIIIAIIRGIGFNLKQFNFAKDIKELEINDKDNEEIEIDFSSNIFKYKRFSRKKLRELKYYFFENKYWILLILGVVLVPTLIYIFSNIKFLNKTYGENTFANAGSYAFSVNRTYVTNTDLYGQIVKEDKKYVIVDISIKNNNYKPILFDTKYFELTIGNDSYYADTTKNNYFKDLGLGYNGIKLGLNTTYNYILIYEIDKKQSLRNSKLKVYNYYDYESKKGSYVNIKLKPNKLDSKTTEQSVNFNDFIKIDEKNYGKTEISIKNYKIINKFEYDYEVCVSNECSKKTSVISPNNLLKNQLIQIDYLLNLDKENNISNFITNSKDFYNTFVTLSYNVEGKKKSLSFNGITNSNIKDKIFMEVSKEIVDADEIELIITTRTKKYIYKLK